MGGGENPFCHLLPIYFWIFQIWYQPDFCLQWQLPTKYHHSKAGDCLRLQDCFTMDPQHILWSHWISTCQICGDRSCTFWYLNIPLALSYIDNDPLIDDLPIKMISKMLISYCKPFNNQRVFLLGSELPRHIQRSTGKSHRRGPSAEVRMSWILDDTVQQMCKIWFLEMFCSNAKSS